MGPVGHPSVSPVPLPASGFAMVWVLAAASKLAPGRCRATLRSPAFIGPVVAFFIIARRVGDDVR